MSVHAPMFYAILRTTAISFIAIHAGGGWSIKISQKGSHGMLNIHRVVDCCSSHQQTQGFQLSVAINGSLWLTVQSCVATYSCS